jgi:hypothetical protein
VIMANDIYYAKTQVVKAIFNDSLNEFQRFCTRYMLNTHLEVVFFK